MRPTGPLPWLVLLAACVSVPARAAEATISYDVVISGGLVYDGTGGSSRRADVGIRKDRIASIGDLSHAPSRVTIDARGLVVAPGFINMLSWSGKSLLIDGRGQSELRQGVTTEVMGEGQSMGPLSPRMKKGMSQSKDQGDFPVEVNWTTLAEYLRHLEVRGVSPNVASFIGAATVRENVLGPVDRAPTPSELERMRELVREEMKAGALGVGSALKYAPGAYASTAELIELCKVAAKYRGVYSSHLRDGDGYLKSLAEFLKIAREAGIPALLHHLNSTASPVEATFDKGLAELEAARAKGLRVMANAYPYTASSNALKSVLPLWAHDGGSNAMLKRLRDKDTRARIRAALEKSNRHWDTIQVSGTRTEGAKHWIGKSIAQVAKDLGRPPAEALMDLLLEDRGGIVAIYFGKSEKLLERVLRLPWVSFGSDGHAAAPEGAFLKSSTHPRAYGAFARVLGKYVREEKLIPLTEAIQRLSAQPARFLGLKDRGLIKEGLFADLAVFDAATIADRATFENPQQFAVGMRYVLVNGVVVIREGEHTGARPGRALWGPGKVD